jgi:hypothetical protein
LTDLLSFGVAYLVEQFALLYWLATGHCLRRRSAFVAGSPVGVGVFTLRFGGYTTVADGTVLALVLVYFWYVR